ncbi:MAG: hypothetical protein GX660_02360, partial [Clostridiaceae bacterium]|nr:hypothetical protein [Clostridiaceae bacterium]
MINYSIENNSICFALCEMLGEPAPIKWMGVCKGLELSQAILLNELIDNGNATLRNDGVQLTFSELLNLSQSDKALLQLPEAYPFDICVDGIGQLNQTTFRYKLVLCEYFGGPFLHCTLAGPFVKFENQSTFLLSAQQFALINSIESFNALPTEKHSFDINLQNHAKIRNLAFEANAKLDSYLNNENIILPEQVEITLSQQVADNFEVSPIVAALPEECQKKFKENFNKYPTIQSVYNTTDNAGQ